MRPLSSDQILDVGVSDVINDGANVLERIYPHQSNITACGLGAGLEFKSAFPLVSYLQIEPNARLPFDDGSFDIATSNAVLEHVGSLENQLLFVRELCRIAQRVFISVPNRFFPVEHHTALPVAHYQASTFQFACWMTGKSEWAREENLILMTRKRLWQIAAPIGKMRSRRLHGSPGRTAFLKFVSRIALDSADVFHGRVVMSAFDPKQTFRARCVVSAFAGRAGVGALGLLGWRRKRKATNRTLAIPGSNYPVDDHVVGIHLDALGRWLCGGERWGWGQSHNSPLFFDCARWSRKLSGPSHSSCGVCSTKAAQSWGRDPARSIWM